MSQPHGLSRRQFLKSTAVGAVGATLGAPAVLRAQGKTGTVRVWGEPGPYGGVAVDGMNEWAQKNAPGLKFAIETIPWRRLCEAHDRPRRAPPCPLHQRRVADRLPADGGGAARAGRRRGGQDRPGPPHRGVKWEYWGAWKGKQYVIPAHHQPHLLVVRTDVMNEPGVTDPAVGLERPVAAAKAIKDKKKSIGLCLRSGAISAPTTTCCAPALGGRTHVRRRRTSSRSSSTARDGRGPRVRGRAAPVHAARRGGLQLPGGRGLHRHRTQRHVFYWGRPYGRAAEENKAVFETLEAFNHARHPKTGRRSNWNDFQGWCIPRTTTPTSKRSSSARLLPDEQGLAGPLLPLADAERVAGVQGRGARSAASSTRSSRPSGRRILILLRTR